MIPHPLSSDISSDPSSNQAQISDDSTSTQLTSQLESHINSYSTQIQLTEHHLSSSQMSARNSTQPQLLSAQFQFLSAQLPLLQHMFLLHLFHIPPSSAAGHERSD